MISDWVGELLYYHLPRILGPEDPVASPQFTHDTSEVRLYYSQITAGLYLATLVLVWNWVLFFLLFFCPETLLNCRKQAGIAHLDTMLQQNTQYIPNFQSILSLHLHSFTLVVISWLYCKFFWLAHKPSLIFRDAWVLKFGTIITTFHKGPRIQLQMRLYMFYIVCYNPI